MQRDHSTKILLVLIAIALWGLLLKPLLQPISTRAEAATAAGSNSSMIIYDGRLWVTNGATVSTFVYDQLNNRIKKLGQMAVSQ